MSRRIALSVAAGVVVLAGAGTAAALAYGGEQAPALSHSSARYTAPRGDKAGSFTFTSDVKSSAGLANLKVLAWPESSTLAKQKPTAKEMAKAERATCEPAGKDTAHCVYTVKVTSEDAASSPRGPWHVSAFATSKDGTTTLVTEAAGFTVG